MSEQNITLKIKTRSLVNELTQLSRIVLGIFYRVLEDRVVVEWLCRGRKIFGPLTRRIECRDWSRRIGGFWLLVGRGQKLLDSTEIGDPAIRHQCFHRSIFQHPVRDTAIGTI